MRGGLGITLIAAVAAPLAAQQAPASWCVRGAPRQRCATFPLTELGFAVGPSTATRGTPVNLTWDVGVMRNVGDRAAIGGSITVIVDDADRTMLGVRPRYRRWLRDRISLDLAPAVLIAELRNASFPEPSFPAFSGFVGLNLGDLVAVTAQAELLRVAGRSETIFQVGLRLGSYPGLIAMPAAAAFVAWVRGIAD